MGTACRAPTVGCAAAPQVSLVGERGHTPESPLERGLRGVFPVRGKVPVAHVPPWAKGVRRV